MRPRAHHSAIRALAGRIGFLAIAGRACAAGLLLALLAAALPAHAQTTAERRVALVVGNADYPRAPLVNPINDAADLATALRRLGFEVIERRNRGSDDLKRDLIEFQDKLGPCALALFNFAGRVCAYDSGTPTSTGVRIIVRPRCAGDSCWVRQDQRSRRGRDHESAAGVGDSGLPRSCAC